MAQGRRDGVSQRTDVLASTLIGTALDRLAVGQDVNVLLAVEDGRDVVASYELAEDGAEQLLEEAMALVRRLVAHDGDAAAGIAAPVRYALVYDGAVELGHGAFSDAILLEFGEVGYRAYSAFVTYENRGDPDGFVWAEPAPAGEVQPLL